MNASSVFLLAVILAATALVLAGCVQSQTAATPVPSARATPYLQPGASNSGFAASPAFQPGSGNPKALAASENPTVSPAASGQNATYLDDATKQDVDAAGSDVEDLETLSGDLSAGDVEYSEGG